MAKAPKLSPGAQSLAGVVVVLGGVAGVVWSLSAGYHFTAFIVAAITVGALVPLYPEEEEATKYL